MVKFTEELLSLILKEPLTKEGVQFDTISIKQAGRSVQIALIWNEVPVCKFDAPGTQISNDITISGLKGVVPVQLNRC